VIFTSSVFWGTIGPRRIWGPGGLYTATLVGFPLGVVTVLVIYFLSTKFSRWTWLRQVHPVVLVYGGILWAPYNMSYLWPAVPISWLSWIYFKKRFLDLWSKVCSLRETESCSSFQLTYRYLSTTLHCPRHSRLASALAASSSTLRSNGSKSRSTGGGCRSTRGGARRRRAC